MSHRRKHRQTLRQRGPMRDPARTKKTAVRSAPSAPSHTADAEKGIRLQRVLAAAGCGSRRHCETFILEGRVEVDGQVITQLGTRVHPGSQVITLDGEPIRPQRLQYYAVHKPQGVVSTSRDPSGRPRVIDLIHTDQRLYNVGRLDKSSEGLMIVTNDGDLAQRLTHPRYGIEKRYLVFVEGRPTGEQLALLERGVHLAEGVAKASRVQIKKHAQGGTWLEIELREGRNREIRRLLARIGHKVLRLVRVGIGPIELGALAVGAYRRLTQDEISRLKQWKPRPPKRTPRSHRQAAPKARKQPS